MDDAKSIKKIDEQAGYAKAEHYCAYQERAQQEVRDKLYEWGLRRPDEVERVIARLIENNYLSESRFANAYAQGKFNQKGWGRIKIKQGLKFKRVPDGLIKKALLILDGDEYFKTLERLLEKKAAILTETHPLKRRFKLQQYALSRGFEADLVAEIINSAEFQPLLKK